MFCKKFDIDFFRSRDVSMSSNAYEDDDYDYEELADMDEDDDGQNDDDQLEDILDNDLSWELEIARRYCTMEISNYYSKFILT